MPVVFLIAAVAVLGGVFFAATGRGGELAPEHPDHAPLDLGSVSAPDVALLRPPTALWGYNMEVTNEALDHIAQAMHERDVTIAYLQQQLAGRETRSPSPSPASAAPPAPLATQAPLAPTAPQKIPLASPPTSQPVPTVEDRQPPRIKAPGVLVAPLHPRAPLSTDVTQPVEVAREAAQPVDAPQPSPSASPLDGHGPQGLYDAHGWWAQQEEAEREEALRQAQAKAAEAPPVQPEAAGPAAPPPAHRHDAEPGRTATQPNPALAAGPDDETSAAEQEPGW